MKSYFAALPAAVVAAFVAAVASAGPSAALTAQECSAKYNAAKAAGTLGDVKWNDFRKAQCGDAEATAAKPIVAKPVVAKPVVAAGAAVFPKAVDAKYASEKAGKQRMLTCRDQYKTNKATNANGGLKWIMKGGGYYSQCNKSLKS